MWDISVSTVQLGYYQTNILNMDVYEKLSKLKWNSVSQDLREEYGYDYPERSRFILLYSYIKSRLILLTLFINHRFLILYKRDFMYLSTYFGRHFRENIILQIYLTVIQTLFQHALNNTFIYILLPIDEIWGYCPGEMVSTQASTNTTKLHLRARANTRHT